ncbi:chorion class B protein B.L1-like [Macrobrachium rosenbergii]|uniref:chorion class B protein B.L1-like n=1 Tax=Macrobrachium rosenbergii TaxID=79674 RepID=UPI0034D56973
MVESWTLGQLRNGYSHSTLANWKPDLKDMEEQEDCHMVILTNTFLVAAEQKRSADPGIHYGGLVGLGYGGLGIGGLGYGGLELFGLRLNGGNRGGYGRYGGLLSAGNYDNGYSHSTGYNHGNHILKGYGGAGGLSHGHLNKHLLGKRSADPEPGLAYGGLAGLGFGGFGLSGLGQGGLGLGRLGLGGLGHESWWRT